MKTYKEFILEANNSKEKLNEIVGPIIRGVSAVASNPVARAAVVGGATRLVKGLTTGAGIAGGATATNYAINKAKQDPQVQQTKSNIEKSVGNQRGFQMVKNAGLSAVERYAKMGQ